MKINQDNYEQYFLDHAEGNLSPEMERELADFLEANPDLRTVLAEYDPSPLQTVEIRNEILKRRLKKKLHPTGHIGENNIDEWLIREVEGLLNETEKNELEEFLSLNTAYIYDQEKFRQTKLIPDPAVTFNNKEHLKKKSPVLPIARLAWMIPAAAAVLLIYFGIRFFQQPAEVEINPAIEVVAVNETPSQITETPSQSNETPSQPTVTHSRYSSFRLAPSIARNVAISEINISIPEMDMVAYSVNPIQTIETKEKPLIAKVFGNMVAKAKDGFSRNSGLEEIDLPDFSFWAMAKAGVEGYNSLSDRELELLVRKDEEGKVKSYALIDNDRLLMSKELNKD
jgi:hypothetical protein